jgi:hypothetical protein
MTSEKPFLYLLLFPLLFSICSCNRYIDAVKSKTKTPIMQGYFDFCPADSNVFVYKTNVGLKRDTEIAYPKSFKVTLPKGLRFYELSGSIDFGFYFDYDQVIFININAFDNVTKQDTFYIPRETELSELILNKLSTTNSKYNIKNISLNNSRRQAILMKGPATILLYNIKPENYDIFLKYVTDFGFIDK